MNFREKSVVFLATGFFVGKIPFAPGTFGTLPGLAAAWGVSRLPPMAAAMVTLLFCGLAVWASHEAALVMKQKDPGAIVIDEMAGMMVALWGLPLTPFTVAAGFLLFRLLDILKPPPIRWVDRHWSGGVGIVLDDVLAGILSNGILRVILILSGLR